MFSRKLLPERKSAGAVLSDPREYTRGNAGRAEAARSTAVTIERAGLRHLPGMYLAGIERDGESLVAVGPEQVLRGNDQLIFVGVVDSVRRSAPDARPRRRRTTQVFKLNDPRAGARAWSRRS